MMNDKELIPLCKRLASRFVRQAAHLGSPKDAFNELVNVAYVAGREGRSILWELVHYVTLPSDRVRKKIGGASQRAFRTGDERRNHQVEEKSPEELLEEDDDKKKAFELIMKLSIDEIVLICFYFGKGKSYKEIGEIFNRTGSWASWKIKGILKRLREDMEG